MIANLFIFLSKNGALGVNFFFVLSGFLITILLLKEEQVSGKINLLYFYYRRVLRIWPLYYLTLFIGFLAYPFFSALHNNPGRETASPLLYILFLGNFNIIAAGPPYSGSLRVLWSLAVEEQFYLVWPLLLIATKNKRILLFSGVIAASIVFRALYADAPVILIYHPMSLAGDFAIGGLLAWGCFRYHTPGSVLIRHYKMLIIFLYSLLMILLFFNDRIFIFPILIISQQLIISMFFAFVIFDQAYSQNPFFELRHNRYFTLWGKYSYGLYCFHIAMLAIALKLFNTFVPAGDDSVFFSWLIPVTGFLLTLATAYLSFRFFESPFLKLKTRFSVIAAKRKKIPPENRGEQHN